MTDREKTLMYWAAEDLSAAAQAGDPDNVRACAARVEELIRRMDKDYGR